VDCVENPLVINILMGIKFCDLRNWHDELGENLIRISAPIFFNSLKLANFAGKIWQLKFPSNLYTLNLFIW